MSNADPGFKPAHITADSEWSGARTIFMRVLRQEQEQAYARVGEALRAEDDFSSRDEELSKRLGELETILEWLDTELGEPDEANPTIASDSETLRSESPNESDDRAREGMRIPRRSVADLAETVEDDSTPQGASDPPETSVLPSLDEAGTVLWHAFRRLQAKASDEGYRIESLSSEFSTGKLETERIKRELALEQEFDVEQVVLLPRITKRLTSRGEMVDSPREPLEITEKDLSDGGSKLLIDSASLAFEVGRKAGQLAQLIARLPDRFSPELRVALEKQRDEELGVEATTETEAVLGRHEAVWFGKGETFLRLGGSERELRADWCLRRTKAGGTVWAPKWWDKEISLSLTTLAARAGSRQST